jgi:phage-related protein
MILKDIDINTYVEKFLTKQPVQVTTEILQELKLYPGESTVDLQKMGKLKRIKKNVWTVRIYNQTGKIWFRLFGRIENQTLYLVHGIKKKSNRLNQNDVRTAEHRIKKYENK